MAFVKFPLELFELRDVTAMAVMLRIIMRMDSDGNGVCFETRTSMCEHLGIDKNTWKKKLEFLEGQGLIIVAKHSNAPHHITLTAKMKGYLGVKNHPLTIFNINLDRGRNFTPKSDQGGTMDQEENKKSNKKKVVRRRRPTNKIPPDPPLSELDAIHRKFLSKSVKTRKSDTEDSGS